MNKANLANDTDTSLANFKIIVSIIFFSIIMRLSIPSEVGHIPNFSPIDAIALLSGAVFSKKRTAIFFSLLSVALGDLLLNKIMLGHWTVFYNGFYWQYASYLLICLLGAILIKPLKLNRMISASLLASLLFFGISNFGVWYSSALYPPTWQGLFACYAAALPFFKNTLLSDLFFSITFFASYLLIKLSQQDMKNKFRSLSSF